MLPNPPEICGFLYIRPPAAKPASSAEIAHQIGKAEVQAEAPPSPYGIPIAPALIVIPTPAVRKPGIKLLVLLIPRLKRQCALRRLHGSDIITHAGIGNSVQIMPVCILILNVAQHM